MVFQSPEKILDHIVATRAAFDKKEAGSREALIDYSRALIASLEIPSEFVQRTFWAEVRRNIPISSCDSGSNSNWCGKIACTICNHSNGS